MISGATYPGVPHVVVAKFSPSIKRASPKSESLITEVAAFFEEKSKFSGLMSL